MKVWAVWKGISTQENEELDGEGEKGVVVKGKDVALDQGCFKPWFTFIFQVSHLYEFCLLCLPLF